VGRDRLRLAPRHRQTPTAPTSCAERQAHPTDDVTSALVNAQVDAERLSIDEPASFFIWAQ